ncbi:MAG: mandelate racemase/muconate lactonizing enzyme family protein [Rubrivivax sp.]
MVPVHLGNTPAPSAAGAFTLTRLQADVLRWPVATPVRTSFGTMVDRPAVLIRAECSDGAFGWGETWCNFPGCGAEHRVRLIDSVVAPLLLGRSFASPEAAFDHLTDATAVLAIQSGEHGPIAQAIAGVDLALWDLVARRAAVPLWQLLGGNSSVVPVYASGINPDRPGETVALHQAAGHRVFKLKVGFGFERDLANVAELRAAARPDAQLMLDANQAWSIDEALANVRRFEPFALSWLEEPLRADRPAAEWQRLARGTSIPLAGGENLLGEAAFCAAIDAASISVVQPDVAKWGGISGGRRVIQRIQAAGLRYCPHFLGAGIGLSASAHLLAAYPGVGDTRGVLEIDGNPNPLRTLLAPALNTLHQGRIDLGDTPGLGVQPQIQQLEQMCAAAHR